MVKVSVIVPIFKVEMYIERCVRSLFEQTLDDIEYIFVNDCTPDNSITILENVLNEYPKRQSQVKIVHHAQNQGLAGARTTGMKAMTGEYMIHCDPDDWVERDMYKTMYNKAIESNADIVVCNFYHEYQSFSKKEIFEQINTPQEYLRYTKKNIWWSLWCRMIKTEIIKSHFIYPIPSINMMEDVCVTMRVYYYAKKIEYVNEFLYHYNRVNAYSIVKNSISLKILPQKVAAIKFLENFFTINNFDISNVLDLYKINTRDEFLLLNPINFSIWRKTFPEVVTIITSNIQLRRSYRLCYKLASNGFYFPLFLYIVFSNILKKL